MEDNNSIEYTFWKFWNKFDIIFPMIQRDYAQGRLSAHAKEVRSRFVNDLHDALSKQHLLSLDFIYGTIKDNKIEKLGFIALDGQQRLTTLFLLHWYIFYKANKLSEFSNNTFSYETRNSSIAFCEKLTKVTELHSDGNESIRDIIKNQNWFLSAWEEDPTVRGMLEMLNCISDAFKNESDFNGFYEKLIAENDCPIKFHVLSLGEKFSLADDLYVKMNARGLALTPFENFKACLFQVLKNEQYKESKSFIEGIDTKWTNLFWRTANEGKKSWTGNVDSEMMKFIRMVLSFSYAFKQDKNDDIPEEETFVESVFNSLLVNAKGKVAIPEEQMTYFKLKEMKTLTEDAIIMLLWSFESIGKLFDGDGNWIENTSYCVKLKEQWRIFVQSEKPSYDNQLFIWAILLCYHGDNQNVNKSEWFRLVRNLVSNTVTDNQERMRSAIKSLQNIYSKFGHNKQELKNEYGHFKGQGEEENEKYDLICKHQSLQNDIYRFEDCPYLEGQIKCLLRWSKENGVFDDNIFITLGNELLDLFKKQDSNKFHIEKILLGMSNSAYPYQFENINRIPTDFKNNKFKGFDLNNVKIHQYSFSNLKYHRDYSWRRLLNDDPQDYCNENTRCESLKACQEQFKQMLLGKFSTNSSHINTTPLPSQIKNKLMKESQWIEYCSNSIMYMTDDGNGNINAFMSKGGKDKFFSKRSETTKI